MKRLLLVLSCALVCMPVIAAGRLAEVSLIDRDTGSSLPTYYYRGEYWVAGAPGARYSIAIRNRSGGRLLAVTAVDGVNVVSGETAAWDQSGYVYEPGQGYEITGWRKSEEQVAAFEFTAAPNSYAARTGRAANIGVIGVALFRERAPQIVQRQEPWNAPLADRAEQAPAGAARAASPASEAQPANQARPAPAPPATLGLMAGAGYADPAAKLGTGHGQREDSHAERVDFERLHDRPDEVVRIRYDSTANLIAMGVIRRPAPLPTMPNPFPASPLARYVPDPPGYR
jgi:hypothetical protein